jgi:DNA-binding MarR family transcriptional regulator
MADKLRREVGKRGPFASLEEEATLNLQRTADRLAHVFEDELKPYGLTTTQYNVLRILRGAAPSGLPCQEIARRMITRDADLTRLLDRLESKKLIARQRPKDDRRVVMITIAQTGIDLLAELDSLVTEMNRAMLSHLGKERLGQLIELLELAREKAEKTS